MKSCYFEHKWFEIDNINVFNLTSFQIKTNSPSKYFFMLFYVKHTLIIFLSPSPMTTMMCGYKFNKAFGLFKVIQVRNNHDFV